MKSEVNAGAASKSWACAKKLMLRYTHARHMFGVVK